ncbi:MAG: hypothetical protein MZV64_31865 [Ignavibacteriales bacterium]|nr:hypothetical protein [Ignavibacteriales bacterium]
MPRPGCPSFRTCGDRGVRDHRARHRRPPCHLRRSRRTQGRAAHRWHWTPTCCLQGNQGLRRHRQGADHLQDHPAVRERCSARPSPFRRPADMPISGNNAVLRRMDRPRDRARSTACPGSMGGLMGRPWQIFSLAKILETTATIPEIPFLGRRQLFTYDDVARHLMARLRPGGAVLLHLLARYRRDPEDPQRAQRVDGQEGLQDHGGRPGTSPTSSCTCGTGSAKAPTCRRSPRSFPSSTTRSATVAASARACAPTAPSPWTRKPEPNRPSTANICYGCGWCCGHCTPNAIVMKNRKTGQIVWNGYGEIADWVTDEEGY